MAGAVARAPCRVGAGVEPGRETAPVSLVDVAPTVLDRLGIAPPNPFDGISLWPNLSAVAPLPQRTLFAEGLIYGPPQSAVVRWPHKIIVNHHDDSICVYNLEQDPRERNSLAADNRELADALIVELNRHQRLAQAPGNPTNRQPAEPDRDVLERLRSLGYLRVTPDAAPITRDGQLSCNAGTGSGPVVHVRWVETLGDAQRAALERSLGLESAEHFAGSTWKYRMPDASQSRLRAIVAHEMVEDTHGFNRQNPELDASARQ